MIDFNKTIEPRRYGSDEGVPIEDVIRQILDDNGFRDVALDVPVSPAWMLRPFEPARLPLGEVLDTLVSIIGWELVPEPADYSGPPFTLRLHEPDLSKERYEP